MSRLEEAIAILQSLVEREPTYWSELTDYTCACCAEDAARPSEFSHKETCPYWRAQMFLAEESNA